MRNSYATYPGLRGKVIYISGGSTGIGAELVSAFAHQGAKVGFVDVDGQSALQLIQSLSEVPHAPHFVLCDVTDVSALQNSIAAVAEHFGDVDVLINNVANDDRRELEQVDEAHFDWSVSINLRPAYFAVQAVVPGMQRRGGGSIINMGSVSWQIRQSECSVYGTLKSAAAGLTRSLSRKLGRDRIRINQLIPGWVMTEKQLQRWVNAAGERAIAENQCLPDKVLPKDIAAMALFLASDDSCMITAQTFVVDGGWT
jgi:NAD(P)-dependent dehydrogenase (short-subunit alcohol dehydrogenase family)